MPLSYIKSKEYNALRCIVTNPARGPFWMKIFTHACILIKRPYSDSSIINILIRTTALLVRTGPESEQFQMN